MNKKGSVFDLFIWMIVSFTLAVTVVVVVYSLNSTSTRIIELAPQIQGSMSESDTNVSQILNTYMGATPSAYENLKWATTAYIFVLMLVILITSFLVRTHPVFFVIYLFIWVLAIILAPILSNTYEILYNNNTLGTTFQGFMGQSWIMLHLPTWVICIGGLAAILLFVNMVRGDGFGI